MPGTELAVARVKDGATVIIGGFGQAGTPFNLVQALVEQGAQGLTVISNSISKAAPLVEKEPAKKRVLPSVSLLSEQNLWR